MGSMDGDGKQQSRGRPKGDKRGESVRLIACDGRGTGHRWRGGGGQSGEGEVPEALPVRGEIEEREKSHGQKGNGDFVWR